MVCHCILSCPYTIYSYDCRDIVPAQPLVSKQSQFRMSPLIPRQQLPYNSNPRSNERVFARFGQIREGLLQIVGRAYHCQGKPCATILHVTDLEIGIHPHQPALHSAVTKTALLERVNSRSHRKCRPVVLSAVLFGRSHPSLTLLVPTMNDTNPLRWTLPNRNVSASPPCALHSPFS